MGRFWFLKKKKYSRKGTYYVPANILGGKRKRGTYMRAQDSTFWNKRTKRWE